MSKESITVKAIEKSASASEAPEPRKSEQVCIIPSHFFFIESVSVPEGLEAGEIGEFAELSLEAISPFPVEQLFWGYLAETSTNTSTNTDTESDTESDTLLVYATHRDRLKNAGFTELEAYAWVLPDFSTLIGAIFPEDCTLHLHSEFGRTLIEFKKGRSVPHAVSSIQAEPETTVPSGAAPASGIGAPASGQSRELTLVHDLIEVDDAGRPTFHHRCLGPEAMTAAAEPFGKWTPLRPSEAQLWAADIRSRSFKETERRSRRTSDLLSRISGWGILLAVLLILGESILMVGGLWLSTLTQKIDKQRPAVARIEDKQSLLNKLEQVAQNELRPVAILVALDATRPKGIYFTGASVEGENLVTIDGIAGTINELNRYTDSLSASGGFTLVGQPKYLTRTGQTTFTVTLSYQNTSEPAPEELEPPAAEEPSSENFPAEAVANTEVER